MNKELKEVGKRRLEFQWKEHSQCKVSKMGACLMPLGDSKQASVVGVK